METNDEGSLKAMNALVGGLVWVRRRNGSWWPGQTMVLDELPESSLVSPKAGTPIKLLGRDDVSVDWYDLEKPKGVKAFRCGEYDSCIEKARAIAANSSKKAVKYTRREAAILQALEIENAHLANDHSEHPVQNGSLSSSSKGNEDSGEPVEAKDKLYLAPELLQSSMSSHEISNVEACKVQPTSGKRRRTPNDSEDEGTEGIKRMRGLEDIAMCMESKVKEQDGAILELRQENGLICDVDLSNSISNGTLANGNKEPSAALTKKRSQGVSANDYSKRRNRRRQLTKVLESTAMVSVPVTSNHLASSDYSPLPELQDSKISRMESVESMKSVSVVINNNSDSTGVSCENAASLNASENVIGASHNKAKDSEISSVSVSVEDEPSDRLLDFPVTEEGKHSAGCSDPCTTSSSKRANVSGLTNRRGRSSHKELVKNEGINGSPCITSLATQVDCNLNEIEKTTSKWQLKGKRNSRQMSKKQEASRNVYGGETNNSLLHSSPSKPQDRLISKTRYEKRNPGRKSALYEVKIVKGNDKPRNVPLVSHMSKFNGKAIVGHPLTVEVLEEDYCSHFGVPAVSMTSKVVKKLKSMSKKKAKKKKTHTATGKSSKPKKSSSLSKKTRRLSALTSQKLNERNKKQTTEKAKETVVACIPLKVVFSRINEVLKGSARQVHRALPSAGNT